MASIKIELQQEDRNRIDRLIAVIEKLKEPITDTEVDRIRQRIAQLNKRNGLS